MDFTWFDVVLFLAIFVNTILGFARGLFREAISILCLIVAIVVAMKFTVPLSEFLSTSAGFKDVVLVITRYANHPGANGPLYLFGFGVSFLLLFVGVYSISEVVNHYVSNIGAFILFPMLAILDRIIAGVLGFIRGYIFALITILIVGLSPVVLTSGWTNSVLVPNLWPNAFKLGAMIKPDGFPNWGQGGGS
jgi:uncharacterized membrane protein required for colicin V production